jgi:peroxiredoxin
MKKIFIILLLIAMIFVSACAKDNSKLPKAIEGATDNIDNIDGENGTGNEEKDANLAPDFELKDMNGNTVKLSDLRGKKVMINFWATWCKYCVQEMPDLMKLQEAHKDDLVILYVNVGESKETIQKFIEEHKLTGTILLDDKMTVASLYGVDAYPTTYAINEKGEVITYMRGMMEYETMEQMFNLIK